MDSFRTRHSRRSNLNTDDSSQSTPNRPQAQRGLRAMLAASGISAAGDGAFLAAAPLAAAAVSRDPTGVALVMAAEYLPWVLVTPFAGVLVDRWPKRPTMIISDLLRGSAVALIAVLVALDMASIPVIAMCAAAMVSGMVFHSASAEAMVADLTDRDEQQLHQINGRLQAANTTGRQLLGPPAGSWSFTVAAWLPFAADALSFLLSAALLRAVPSRQAAPPTPTRMWPALREGAVYLARHQELRTLALLTGAANISVAMSMATFVLFATDPNGLGISTAAYGLLLAATAAGGIVGGLIASRIIGFMGNRVAILASFVVQAIGWVLLAATHNPWIAGALLALLWISFSVSSVVIMGTRQRQTPPELLGRVISAYRIIGNGVSPIGALAGGAIALAFGLRAPMVVAAVVLVLAVIPMIHGFKNGTNRSR